MRGRLLERAKIRHLSKKMLVKVQEQAAERSNKTNAPDFYVAKFYNA